MTRQTVKTFLLQLFTTAWQSASAEKCLPDFIPDMPDGKVVVVGAGKAAAAMAASLEPYLPKDTTGLVLTRYGHGCKTTMIEVVEAAHPVPDQKGLEGAKRIMQMVSGLTVDDLVICLISGGGSSLLALPAKGITLADKQTINSQLLRSGAPIDEMNCVRKHLSAIKGGRLALAACPARIETLIISDVPGNDPSVIASGPTVGDTTTAKDALAIIDKYHLQIPDNVYALLQSPQAATPCPQDKRLASSFIHLIATPAQSLEQAAKLAVARGFKVINLGDEIEGEARIIASQHAQMAIKLAKKQKPVIIISGGETTVTVKGNGRGGRNAEYALALAIALDGNRAISAIACDSDGIDGSEDNAGAMVFPDTLTRAENKRLDARACLDDNDAYSFFAALDDLVITGPTRTNINDFRAIIINPGK